MPNNDGELKVGYMVKRSQGKSTLGATNFKKRVFVLTPNRLSYYDGTPEKRGELKGFVDLSRVTVVEKVVDTAFDKPSFQITHDDLTLYVVTKSVEEQEEWIDFIKHYCNSSMLQGKYHPGVFTSGKWTCCGHKSKHSQGCAESSVRSQLPPVISASPKQSRSTKGPTKNVTTPAINPGAALNSVEPVPSTQTKKGGASTSSITGRPPIAPPKVTFEVVACFDYKGERGDLSFKKGQVLTVVDDSQQHWWKARDANGNEGTIPSNYVTKKKGLETEDWYSPDLSRVAAETILKEDGKEGCFVVRNSSKENSYTLSLLHDSAVRHYHIKQDAAGNYFISEKHVFPSVKELVEYHKLNGGGLSTRLRKPPSNMAQSEPAPIFDEQWEIDKADLELGKELGSGQFGRVIAGKWKSLTDVAIKMMKEGSMNEDDFIAEAKVMKAFKHDNLVRLYGVCTKQGPVFIVTEFMVNGCLLQYIRHKRDIITQLDTLVDMAIQICSAMAYLEGNGFIHRDLAARNCLVGERNIVKVADFGLARFVTDDEYTASEGTKFPIKWAAPEVITYAKFSSKSDVWSYGILLWELWTGGKTPYPTFSNSQVLDQVLMGYRLEQPKTCTPEIYRIMYSTWQASPEARPTFKELLASLKQLLDYSETNEND